jgi:hypothetical protein
LTCFGRKIFCNVHDLDLLKSQQFADVALVKHVKCRWVCLMDVLRSFSSLNGRAAGAEGSLDGSSAIFASAVGDNTSILKDERRQPYQQHTAFGKTSCLTK